MSLAPAVIRNAEEEIPILDLASYLAGRPGEADVFDARQRRRGDIHQRHHGAELRAQLRQRGKIARHADGLDELTHDLSLGVHRAAPQADAVAVEKAQRILLAHRRVRQLQRWMTHDRSFVSWCWSRVTRTTGRAVYSRPAMDRTDRRRAGTRR